MKFIYKILIIFINIFSVSSFSVMSIPQPPSSIKHIEYSTAYSSLNKWCLINKRKITTDIMWLTRSKSIYPRAIMLGIYDHRDFLNFICYLEVLKEEDNNILLKLQNVFSNPLNNLDDDYNLILSLKNYAWQNNLLINDDELKNINDGRYFLTVMYYSFISCS